MEARPRCNKQPYCTNVTSHHIVKYTHDEGTDQAAALLLHLATHRDVCRYGRKCSDSTSYHRLTYLHFCSSGLSCEDTAPDHRDSYVHSTPPPRARVDDPGSEDDAPMASGVTHRDVVTDAADVALLLEANRSGRRVRRPCKRAAGVFPVATDPTTGRCWVLLGLSTRKQDHVLCHFHGFTDPGETSFIGAAREGWEESKGCFASRSTLWRALTASSLQCAGDSTFAVPFMNRHCYLVHLGDYTESERQRLCDAFHAAPVYSKCMAEVASLHWIAGDELAVACRSAAETRQHSDSIRVTGFPEGARLRGFLGKWLTADAGEWQRDDLVSLLEGGDASRIPLLPLSQLPALHLEGHELLDFLEAIGIPFCGVCRTEGHTTEQHVPIVYDE